MAINPIDLQTLFTQVDKVGKEQANQKQGLQLQQSIQGAQIQRRTDERIQSVNESQDAGQGPERIKDRSPRKRRDEGEGQDGGDTELLFADPRAGDDPSVIRDPALGKNIDLSG
ncbi:hypothetical protein [Treponema primitia]|uniref:hypothetical protein n=1 Tax=Treponema primitia TaxID=88058 RepID=UPI00025558F7|nr:hypothetical protein [Treponema primitia]